MAVKIIALCASLSCAWGRAKNLTNRLAAHRQVAPLSQACLDALQTYDFPGNVRELENILERALALCNDNVIEVGDLHLPEKIIHIDKSVDATTLHLERGESYQGALFFIQTEAVNIALMNIKGY